MAVSCSIHFDRQYLFGIHGWLDGGKLIFGLITWLILLLTNTSGKGVWTFLLSMSVASWVGTLLWIIILGIFFPCLTKNCCTKHIPWIWILFAWNGLMAVIFIIADVLCIINTASCSTCATHSNLAAATSFACFATAIHAFDGFLYYRQRDQARNHGDDVVI